jgi:hypothetical protein
MSGGMTAAALYACTMTNPAALGAVPEESEAKAHHLKDGKGFTNPWESWRYVTYQVRRYGKETLKPGGGRCLAQRLERLCFGK